MRRSVDVLVPGDGSPEKCAAKAAFDLGKIK
jgi:hypothetical protein